MLDHYGDYKTGIMGEYKCTNLYSKLGNNEMQNWKIMRVNGDGDVKLGVMKLH